MLVKVKIKIGNRKVELDVPDSCTAETMDDLLRVLLANIRSEFSDMTVRPGWLNASLGTLVVVLPLPWRKPLMTALLGDVRQSIEGLVRVAMSGVVPFNLQAFEALAAADEVAEDVWVDVAVKGVDAGLRQKSTERLISLPCSDAALLRLMIEAPEDISTQAGEAALCRVEEPGECLAVVSCVASQQVAEAAFFQYLNACREGYGDIDEFRSAVEISPHAAILGAMLMAYVAEEPALAMARRTENPRDSDLPN